MKPRTKEYYRLHMWVRRQLGRPDSCEVCGKSNLSLDWANISGEYQKDTTDYASLCKPCHRSFDGHTGLQSIYCKRGHKKEGDNLVVIARKNRPTIEYGCRECYRMRGQLNYQLRRSYDQVA